MDWRGISNGDHAVKREFNLGHDEYDVMHEADLKWGMHSAFGVFVVGLEGARVYRGGDGNDGAIHGRLFIAGGREGLIFMD